MAARIARRFKLEIAFTRMLLPLALCAGCGLAAEPLPKPLPPDNLERGLKLYRSGELERAAPILEQATVDFSDEPKAWTYLGLARVQLGLYEEALPAFHEALKLDEEAPEAHYGMGLALAHLHRVDEAIDALERAVQHNPTHAYAHYHLGLAYNERDETDETLVHLRRFLELRPRAPEAARVKALLLSRLR